MKLFRAPAFLRRKQFERSAARHGCEIDAELMLVDRILTYSGRVTDLSRGGALFRPRLAYLLYRKDVPVCLMIGGHELFGRITGTTPAGFGVRFDDNLADQDLQAILRTGAGDENVSSPMLVPGTRA